MPFPVWSWVRLATREIAKIWKAEEKQQCLHPEGWYRVGHYCSSHALSGAGFEQRLEGVTGAATEICGGRVL